MATLISDSKPVSLEKDVKKAPEIVVTAVDDADSDSEDEGIVKGVTEIHIQEVEAVDEVPAILDVHGPVEGVTSSIEDAEHKASNTATRTEDSSITALLALGRSTHLISSPYTSALNQLSLHPLPPPTKLLALALTTLKPTTQAYATSPYTTAFNWASVFSTLRALCAATDTKWTKQTFYVVVFRSILKSDADREKLGLLDQKSHEEACQSGGLLKYWFGTTDARRRNLATCLWLTREDAAAGGKGPWHKKARGAAREMYESISFQTHTLVVDDGAEAWELQDHQG